MTETYAALCAAAAPYRPLLVDVLVAGCSDEDVIQWIVDWSVANPDATFPKHIIPYGHLARIGRLHMDALHCPIGGWVTGP